MFDSVMMTLAVGRISERLLIAAAAAMALAFGWHLFKSGVVVDQSATGEFKGFKVVFSKVGPGVFFAAFGAGVLITGLLRPMTLPEGSPTNSNPRGVSDIVYVNESQADLLDMIRTANAVLSAARTSDDSRLKKASHILEALKGRIALHEFSTDDLRVYKENRAVFLSNPAALTPEIRTKVGKMVDLLDAEFDEGG